MGKFQIICHGGGWSIPDDKVELSVLGVKSAAQIGYDALKDGAEARCLQMQ